MKKDMLETIFEVLRSRGFDVSVTGAFNTEKETGLFGEIVSNAGRVVRFTMTLDEAKK